MYATALRSCQLCTRTNAVCDASLFKVGRPAIKARSRTTCAAARRAREAEIEDDGSSVAQLAELAPEGKLRGNANTNVNGVILRHDCRTPGFEVRGFTHLSRLPCTQRASSS